MKIILNETKEFSIGSFDENISNFGFAFTGIYLVSVGDTTNFPVLEGLDNFQFTSIKVINNNGVEIPLQGDYSKIDSINVSYDDSSNNYIIAYHIS